MCFKSKVIERTKIARKTRCGTINATGTANGKLKNAGKTIVKAGTVSNKL